MRLLLKAIPLAAAMLLSGCYYAVIETGRPPSGQTVERGWVSSFVGGLVGPPIRAIARECPDGAARVEAQHTWPNLVATWLTLGLYSPVAIKVSCAAEQRRRSTPPIVTMAPTGILVPVLHEGATQPAHAAAEVR